MEYLLGWQGPKRVVIPSDFCEKRVVIPPDFFKMSFILLNYSILMWIELFVEIFAKYKEKFVPLQPEIGKMWKYCPYIYGKMCKILHKTYGKM